MVEGVEVIRASHPRLGDPQHGPLPRSTAGRSSGNPCHLPSRPALLRASRKEDPRRYSARVRDQRGYLDEYAVSNPTGIATFVRTLDEDFTGDARLYRLEPPITYPEWGSNRETARVRWSSAP